MTTAPLPRYAVLLTGHGTVERAEDIPEFLLGIRRGRPAPAELVEEVTRRLEIIGGSPFRRLSESQADALQQRLNIPVRAAARLWHPRIEAVLGELVDQGITKVISLPMAPQSVHVYQAAVQQAAQEIRAKRNVSLDIVEVGDWAANAGLIAAISNEIDATLRNVDGADVAKVPVLLSFHSLPLRAIQAGDPYEKQVKEMCDAIVAHRNDGRSYQIVYQSKGFDGGQWLGPELLETIDRLAEQGHQHVVVSAAGFLVDHVEVLYDIDIEAKKHAESRGVTLHRAPSVNVSPTLITALAELCAGHLEASHS